MHQFLSRALALCSGWLAVAFFPDSVLTDCFCLSALFVDILSALNDQWWQSHEFSPCGSWRLMLLQQSKDPLLSI